MATHSSIHAWRMPWTGEPGGLPSMGLQRDRTERWNSGSKVSLRSFQPEQPSFSLPLLLLLLAC